MPALDDDREEALAQDIYAFGPKGPLAIKMIRTDEFGDTIELPYLIGAREWKTGRQIYAAELPGPMGDKIRSLMTERGMPLPPMYVPKEVGHV